MQAFTPNPIGDLYAQALLELGDESGQTDRIAGQVADLAQLLRDAPDLRTLTESPAIKDADRAGVVQRVFEGRLADPLYKLLQVMTRKGRLSQLPAMTASFKKLLDERNGIVPVDAWVAAPMDADTVQRVKNDIGHALGGKTIELEQHVDENLIGGLKVKIGDTLIDASVATQLRSIRTQLIEAGRAKAGAAATA
ncbi:MAG: ATP synthase F1 subunit delta [Planctomycetota bacterium]